MRFVATTVALVLIVVVGATLRSDEPIGSSVTFNREVIRIFERRCLHCHTGGGNAMPLGNYRDARLWARGIREEIVEQRMPPWRAAPGYGAFRNDIGLTPRERMTILTWADSGAPRGDDRDLPQRTSGSHAAHPPADYTLALPPQQIAPGESAVRRVTIDAAVAADRPLRHIQIVPGDRRVLRAAFVTAASRARTQWIGVWTPWLPVLTPPDRTAFRVDADARLDVELHYTGIDRPVEDRSQLALALTSAGAHGVGQFVLDVKQTVPPRVSHTQILVRQTTRLWALLPDSLGPGASVDGGSLEISAHQPNGAVDVLLWIPNRRHEWPTPYVLQEPVTLSAGTIVKVRSTSPTRVAFSTATATEQ